MDVFGFALAWVMTTAAGALVFGHVMARSQPPLVVQVPEVSHSAALPSDSQQVSCPKSSWEPPVVPVADLPEAPQAHSWPQRILASNDVAPAPVARPVQETVRRAPASPKAWAAAVRHVRFTGPTEPSGSKAKASPKTLEEWMRASVDPG
jgi:hypothetical protein